MVLAAMLARLRSYECLLFLLLQVISSYSLRQAGLRERVTGNFQQQHPAYNQSPRPHSRKTNHTPFDLHLHLSNFSSIPQNTNFFPIAPKAYNFFYSIPQHINMNMYTYLVYEPRVGIDCDIGWLRAASPNTDTDTPGTFGFLIAPPEPNPGRHA